MLTLTLMLLAGASTPATCDSLRTLSTTHVTVTAAEIVPAGVFVAPPAPGAGRGAPPAAATAAPQRPEPIPQHCRVKLTLKPSSDSNIYSELWLPTDGWNGRLLVVGNGGFAGSIQGYGDMQIALRLGYATAATDTGHNAADGPNGMFALGHPEKIVDFAYRALHETTVESKRLIRDFYNRTPQVLVLQGLLDGRAPGHHGGHALPRRLRRHHRRRARQPSHPHAHGRVGAPDRARAAPGHGDLAGEGADGQRRRDGQVRHASRRLPEQPAAVHVRLHEAPLQGRGVERVPHAAAAQGRRDVLWRREEQQGRSDLRGPGAGQPADPAAQQPDGQRERHRSHLGIPERRLRLAHVRHRSRHARDRPQDRLRGRHGSRI